MLRQLKNTRCGIGLKKENSLDMFLPNAENCLTVMPSAGFGTRMLMTFKSKGDMDIHDELQMFTPLLPERTTPS